MHTDAEPFLQRIRAFPDDDVPRLIFADWLEEQGEAGANRAAFIRAQVALAGLPADDLRRPAILAVEQHLFDAHRDEWEAPFRGLATGLVFRRGFVDEANVSGRDFLRQAHALFTAGPIRHLHLLDVGGSLPGVAQSAYLSRLRALTVYGQHTGEPLARILSRCSHLAGLRELDLRRNRLGDDAAAHLATSPILANLNELDLSENEIGEAGARTLAASAQLIRVRRLNLSDNPIGPAGAEALAGSDRLAALHQLILARVGLGVSRLHTLGHVSNLLRVPVLDLSGNTLGPAGLKVILSRPLFPPDSESELIRSRELDLSHNDLGETGARILAEAPVLAGWEVLRLRGCGLTDEAARLLAHSPHLNRLHTLDLGCNTIGDRGFRAFLETPHLRGLRKLVIPGVGVPPPMHEALNRRFHRGVYRA